VGKIDGQLPLQSEISPKTLLAHECVKAEAGIRGASAATVATIWSRRTGVAFHGAGGSHLSAKYVLARGHDAGHIELAGSARELPAAQSPTPPGGTLTNGHRTGGSIAVRAG